MKQIRLLLPIAAIVLAVSGCGTVQATDEAREARAHSTGAEAPVPIDAALVTPDFGWVLTADRLLVTRDGGTSFSEIRPPVPVTGARAAFFSDAQNGYVAASNGNAITTARTTDGGRTWKATTTGDPSAPAAEYGRLEAAFRDADHGVILAQTSRSMMSSTATLFATEDGGASWSARRAPMAGEISIERDGRIWVAGGVAGDRLSSSSDQGRHWTDANVKVDGTATSKAIAPPVGGVLPVTVVTETDQTQVALLTSDDEGGSWSESGRVAVQGKTGPGVRVPVAPTGNGLLVVDTRGGHAYRVQPGRAASASAAPDVRPRGLPDGADRVTFAADGRTGWALAVYGRCTNGKSGCSLFHPLLTTTDGGATWRELRMWEHRIN